MRGGLGPSGNYLSRFRPTAPTTTTAPEGHRRSTSTTPAVSEVRRWVVDNALRWFAEFYINALRLDAVHDR